MKKTYGKAKWMRHVIAAIVILFIEIFLWNHSYWLSLRNEPIVVDELYTQSGDLVVFDRDYLLEEEFSLEIRDICAPVKNIYLNIATDKEERQDILQIQMSMIDDGRKDYYELPVRVISSKLQKADYISLYPYGNLKSLKIAFPEEGGGDSRIRVENIVLNARVPMLFSVWRVLLMYLLYLAGTVLFFRPYSSLREWGSVRQRYVIWGLCAVFIVLVGLLALRGYSEVEKSLQKYTDLTHALSQGKVSLAMYAEDSEILLRAENPYNSRERSEVGFRTFELWDYTYYEGKFYVYFGVVPVLCTYLPYYLLTGQDLSHIAAYLFFLLPLVAGSFLLLDELARKYCSKIPLKLYYLFLVTFMTGSGVFIFAKRVCIYNLAILAGVCFTVWGLYFWLSSVKDSGQCVKWKVFLGAGCMALVAGCRPQLLIGSLMAIPIFGAELKRAVLGLRSKERRAEHMVFLLALVVPFLAVAAFMMKYNYARFGSVFDFGASYNLTGYDMRYLGFHLARIIDGLWALLFRLPAISPEFPYLELIRINTAYQGITIQESGIGGIFATNLILWPCFLMYHYRSGLREKKVLAMAAICLGGEWPLCVPIYKCLVF